MAKKDQKIYSPSQVNSLIKVVLGEHLPPRLTVNGQISGWKHHSSGHCYFSLKDQMSVLPCVMWKSSFAKVKFQPEDGMAVLATGFIDIYEPQGKYQFYVEKLEPVGVGALQLAFEQMVRKLEEEGLFKDEYKKPLPAYPQRIGILTSESGAAVRDIEDSIQSRWPCVKLFLYPVPVQGDGAAEKIAKAIRDINKRNKELKLDILIVGRGGGSLEDLWAFNEEVLARAIFESQIPIISAVGHEVDITIADLVADARASTPTKAGVVAVPDMSEVLGQLAHHQSSLATAVKWNLESCQKNLQILCASSVFRNPLLPILNRQQQLDELSNRTYIAIREIVNEANIDLTAGANRLAGLNPKAVLQRGYSITSSKKTGAVIRKSSDVAADDLIITELANENLVESKVTKK